MNTYSNTRMANHRGVPKPASERIVSALRRVDPQKEEIIIHRSMEGVVTKVLPKEQLMERTRFVDDGKGWKRSGEIDPAEIDDFEAVFKKVKLVLHIDPQRMLQATKDRIKREKQEEILLQQKMFNKQSSNNSYQDKKLESPKLLRSVNDLKLTQKITPEQQQQSLRNKEEVQLSKHDQIIFQGLNGTYSDQGGETTKKLQRDIKSYQDSKTQLIYKSKLNYRQLVSDSNQQVLLTKHHKILLNEEKMKNQENQNELGEQEYLYTPEKRDQREQQVLIRYQENDEEEEGQFEQNRIMMTECCHHKQKQTINKRELERLSHSLAVTPLKKNNVLQSQQFDQFERRNNISLNGGIPTIPLVPLPSLDFLLRDTKSTSPQQKGFAADKLNDINVLKDLEEFKGFSFPLSDSRTPVIKTSHVNKIQNGNAINLELTKNSNSSEDKNEQKQFIGRYHNLPQSPQHNNTSKRSSSISRSILVSQVQQCTNKDASFSRGRSNSKANQSLEQKSYENSFSVKISLNKQFLDKLNNNVTNNNTTSKKSRTSRSSYVQAASINTTARSYLYSDRAMTQECQNFSYQKKDNLVNSSFQGQRSSSMHSPFSTNTSLLIKHQKSLNQQNPTHNGLIHSSPEKNSPPRGSIQKQEQHQIIINNDSKDIKQQKPYYYSHQYNDNTTKNIPSKPFSEEQSIVNKKRSNTTHNIYDYSKSLAVGTASGQKQFEKLPETQDSYDEDASYSLKRLGQSLKKFNPSRKEILPGNTRIHEQQKYKEQQQQHNPLSSISVQISPKAQEKQKAQKFGVLVDQTFKAEQRAVELVKSFYLKRKEKNEDLIRLFQTQIRDRSRTRQIREKFYAQIDNVKVARETCQTEVNKIAKMNKSQQDFYKELAGKLVAKSGSGDDLKICKYIMNGFKTVLEDLQFFTREHFLEMLRRIEENEEFQYNTLSCFLVSQMLNHLDMRQDEVEGFEKLDNYKKTN